MNNKKPGQWNAFLWMTWYVFKAQLRNPATFAFGFIFPIVFISIFGLIGDQTQKLTIGILESQPKTQIITSIQDQPFVKIERGDSQLLNDKLKRGRIDAIIATNSKDNQTIVHLLTTQANPQKRSSVIAFVDGVVNQTNLKVAGIKNPAITLANEEVSGRKFRYIDFALPGQIGFSLLSTAIFSTVFGLVFLKKALIFKRMFATPTSAMTILLAQGMSRMISAMLQTILILIIGIVVFNFYLPHGLVTFGELMLLSVIGLMAFLGFGFFIAGFVNDENSASPLVNLVTLPQFLLSGVFFSTESFPTWIQPIANNLPLSYFNIAIRKVTIDGGSLIDTWPYMAGLILWGVVMYFLAAKTFKWT